MRIILIADTFPPLRTSGAVQLRDLSLEIVRQGHKLTVLLPSADLPKPWSIEDFFGVRVVRLKAPKTKDINYVQRAINEFVMPFFMLRNLRKSPLENEKWDGIVWYSPSIFHGPLASALKRSSGCKGYLIIRDIFPQWAVDMELMGKGLPYHFFDAVAKYQYSVADIIGVQTQGNLTYFDEWSKRAGRHLEVLRNWLADAPASGCSISLAETPLGGRKMLVYAGNMGVAQGVGILLDLAERFSKRPDIGFLFVGRGSEVGKLAARAANRNLDNVLFRDEISPEEIPGLYAQCHVGLLALDPRHKSHNIPGKFLTYMQMGLPVLANINAGNDLAGIIRNENVGRVAEDGTIDVLERLALELVDGTEIVTGMQARCRNLYLRIFTSEKAVQQLLAALSVGNH